MTRSTALPICPISTGIIHEISFLSPLPSFCLPPSTILQLSLLLTRFAFAFHSLRFLFSYRSRALHKQVTLLIKYLCMVDSCVLSFPRPFGRLNSHSFDLLVSVGFPLHSFAGVLLLFPGTASSLKYILLWQFASSTDARLL